jgi:hypothetical protein
MRQWNHSQKHCRSIEQQNSVSGFLSVHNRFFLWIRHPGISSHDVVFPIGVWIVVKISFRSLDRPLKIERWSACILSSCWCLRSEVLFLQEALGTFMIIRTVKGIQRRDGGTLCKMHLGAPLLVLWNSLVLLSNISKSRNICFHPSVASLDKMQRSLVLIASVYSEKICRWSSPALIKLGSDVDHPSHCPFKKKIKVSPVAWSPASAECVMGSCDRWEYMLYEVYFPCTH